jgi:hypothetical protein
MVVYPKRIVSQIDSSGTEKLRDFLIFTNLKFPQIFESILYLSSRDSMSQIGLLNLTQFIQYIFFNATTCPLWTSWSPLPVVAEV